MLAKPREQCLRHVRWPQDAAVDGEIDRRSAQFGCQNGGTNGYALIDAEVTAYVEFDNIQNCHDG